MLLKSLCKFNGNLILLSYWFQWTGCCRFCTDNLIENGIVVKWNFHWIWIVRKKNCEMNTGRLETVAGRSEYSRRTRSIPCLLMPWLLMSPGHQQVWCWLWRIYRSLASMRKDFNNLCLLCVWQAWEFSGFFRISRFFRAKKILKSIQIMQSFHILNKNIAKIVPWP